MNVLFEQMQAPGDLVVLTAALRDLKLSYPDINFNVRSCYPEVFYNNSYIDHSIKDGVLVPLEYADWKRNNHQLGYHFVDAFYKVIEEALNISPIVKTSPFPYIELTEEEKSEDILDEWGIQKPYWVINPGTKIDIPLKQYHPYKWQIFVNHLAFDLHRFRYGVVQAGHSDHLNPQLNYVFSLVGRTNNLRDYFRLIYHSSGSVGHVSLHMHVAAAFRKPCIVIAGGREDVRWERYPGQHFLHTEGMLDCCLEGGCWNSQYFECVNVDDGGNPLCFQMINPNQVSDLVIKLVKYR